MDIEKFLVGILKAPWSSVTFALNKEKDSAIVTNVEWKENPSEFYQNLGIYWMELRSELLKHFRGKWAVITNQKLGNFYKTYSNAVQNAGRKLSTYLIKKRTIHWLLVWDMREFNTKSFL
jgi:hypothetical protein